MHSDGFLPVLECLETGIFVSNGFLRCNCLTNPYESPKNWEVIFLVLNGSLTRRVVLSHFIIFSFCARLRPRSRRPFFHLNQPHRAGHCYRFMNATSINHVVIMTICSSWFILRLKPIQNKVWIDLQVPALVNHQIIFSLLSVFQALMKKMRLLNAWKHSGALQYGHSMSNSPLSHKEEQCQSPLSDYLWTWLWG